MRKEVPRKEQQLGGGVSSDGRGVDRDMYGFAVRPQHLQRYREHANIYREEEVERSQRWEQFLSTHNESREAVAAAPDGIASDGVSVARAGIDEAGEAVLDTNAAKTKSRRSLWAVEEEVRIRTKNKSSNGIRAASPERRGEGGAKASAAAITAGGDENGEDDDSEEEFYDVERTEVVQDGGVQEGVDQSSSEVQEACPWGEEIKILVYGGVPMALRGELWQVFVGAKNRMVDGYYQALLARSSEGGNEVNGAVLSSVNSSSSVPLEKWASQIEKDLPRTFPGHPSLEKDGLNTLRRLLTAYARHNPSVGYCQAMNFLAALLLLLMPEENAFWTLTAIIDDYFEGYYSEKMVEAQVDQLVFEQLIKERFPRLTTHLESLGVQVTWVSGPWFLSIFVNVLPWESVLRVWDALLYEGDRSMLFRTGLALIEMHAGSLLQQRDTGDFVAMLQSMGEATFDSSQLVLSACLGFQAIDEIRLQELRIQYRPAVLAALHERSLELQLLRTANGSGTKNGPMTRRSANGILPIKASLSTEQETLGSIYQPAAGIDVSSKARALMYSGSLEDDESIDLQEQVVWLKTELCRSLEDQKLATQRSQELETALMEMVKEDNRRLLSAQVEKLEVKVAELKKALSDKQEQETAMVQVLVRMEQEQRVAEDARIFAEQEAERHQHVASEAEEKAKEATEALAGMEQRAVMAESMLEATLNSQAGGVPQGAKRGLEPKGNSPKGIVRSHSSPSSNLDPETAWGRRHSTGKLDGGEESPKPSIFGRPFSLSWRDKSKLRVETKAGEFDNLQAEEAPSPVLAPSSAPPIQEHANGHSQTSGSEPSSELLQGSNRLLQTNTVD